MRLFSTPTVTMGRNTLRLVPAVVALFYPLALMVLYQGGRQFAQALDATEKLTASILLCLAVGRVYCVPALSFLVVFKASDDMHARRIAHLAFAAPPLFVLVGVVFYMVNIPNGDYVVWG